MPPPAPETTAYPHLLSPIEIGGRRLKTRIVHASVTTKFQSGGEVTDRLIDYHVNRARGGAALCVTEPLAVLSRQLVGAKVDVFSGRNAEGLQRWAGAVAAEGSGLIGQIQDPGRGRHEEGRITGAIGASALPDDLSWTVPYALTTGEVERVIEEFAVSARRLADAGFWGVEISAGHGHLFHQFLSAQSNRRTDRYGGDLPNRARLLTDVIAAIRAACGPDFLIGIKLPGADGVPGGIGLVEAAEITALVHATGALSYLTYCWGAHAETLDWHLPDLHGPRTPWVENIARLARHAPGVPVGALGLITDPNEGERFVRDGLADLVMVGRPLVTDPAWGRKAAEGREAQIRYCVGCNTCWHVISTGGKLQCDNNPRVGEADEADWRPASTPRVRRVVVVGAGPAGLEAAWVAAARGHNVTLFGAGEEPGGKTRVHALLPGGENLSSVHDYQTLAARRHGVTLRLGERAEVADVLALEPDAVVLATGAKPSWPAFLPQDWRDEGLFPDIRTMVTQMLPFSARQPGTALVYDHDQTAFTYAATEFLQARFEQVVLVTPRERLAAPEALVNRQGIYRRLFAKGVDIVLLSEISAASAFEDGEVTLTHVYTGEERTIGDIALLTYATPRVPDDALAVPLRAAGVEVHLIGDAYAPRFLLNATAEGYRVGSAL